MRNRINKWCENENVFSESQFGFLFISFINDIDSCINTDQSTENDVNLLSMHLLLFADDIVFSRPVG